MINIKHSFRLRTYIWKSLTKHCYNWEWLRRFDLQTNFSILICNEKPTFRCRQIGYIYSNKTPETSSRTKFGVITHAIISWSGRLYFLDSPSDTYNFFSLHSFWQPYMIMKERYIGNRIIWNCNQLLLMVSEQRIRHSKIYVEYANHGAANVQYFNKNSRMNYVFQSFQLIIRDGLIESAS